MEAAGVSPCQAEVSIVVDECCIHPACYKGGYWIEDVGGFESAWWSAVGFGMGCGWRGVEAFLGRWAITGSNMSVHACMGKIRVEGRGLGVGAAPSPLRWPRQPYAVPIAALKRQPDKARIE